MPDALELPGTRRAVVIEVRAGCALVRELVSDRIPGLASVVRALNDLPEPAGVLGGIDPVGVDRRPLDVVDVPAGDVRSADVPLLALGIRCHHECALVRPNQYPNSAHASLLPESSLRALREYGTPPIQAGISSSSIATSTWLAAGSGRSTVAATISETNASPVATAQARWNPPLSAGVTAWP